MSVRIMRVEQVELWGQPADRAKVLNRERMRRNLDYLHSNSARARRQLRGRWRKQNLRHIQLPTALQQPEHLLLAAPPPSSGINMEDLHSILRSHSESPCELTLCRFPIPATPVHLSKLFILQADVVAGHGRDLQALATVTEALAK